MHTVSNSKHVESDKLRTKHTISVQEDGVESSERKDGEDHGSDGLPVSGGGFELG